MIRLFISQLVAATVSGLISGSMGGQNYLLASMFGAILGMLITLLALRSTERMLIAATRNRTHGLVVLYAGVALRYAVAALGLLAGFKLLHLAAEPLVGSFVLMILVQALVAAMAGPDRE